MMPLYLLLGLSAIIAIVEWYVVIAKSSDDLKVDAILAVVFTGIACLLWVLV